MKTQLSKILTIGLFTVAFSACSDDFLEYKPIARETTETFYTSVDNLDYTATAAYGMLCSRDVYDVFYTVGFQSSSDDTETGGENTNDWPEFQRMDRLSHTPLEGSVHAYWGYIYKGLRFANTFLEYRDAVREMEAAKKSPKEMEEIDALLATRTAEMMFLRAYFHFTLMQIYGGVPIATQVVDPSEFSRDKNSIAEVLHQVQADLLAAIPDLKTKGEQPSAEVGRATKGAAQALLAKAYLYESSYAENFAGDARFAGCEEKYDLALQYANEVVNSTDYALVGEEGERFASWRAPVGQQIGGYRWLFTVDGDNSPEGVWEIENVQDGKGWTVSRGNYITVYTTIRFLEDGTSMGWSFNLPSHYLLRAFGNNDSRETGLNSVACDSTLDPRFQATIGMEGDTVLTASGWQDMSFSNLPTGTIGRKYECAPDEYWNTRNDWHDGPFNMRMIRYADVVLMAAEAAYKEGNTAYALQLVNRIRTRARNSGTTGYPQDLTAISFEDIIHERRLELACEQSRLFDVVRWGLGPKFLDGVALESMGEGFETQFVPGKHEFFPIPQVEIQICEGAISQYPGWN